MASRKLFAPFRPCSSGFFFSVNWHLMIYKLLQNYKVFIWLWLLSLFEIIFLRKKSFTEQFLTKWQAKTFVSFYLVRSCPQVLFIRINFLYLRFEFYFSFRFFVAYFLLLLSVFYDLNYLTLKVCLGSSKPFESIAWQRIVANHGYSKQRHT